jgi:transcriptional regulator with XRE-family HTH domain
VTGGEVIRETRQAMGMTQSEFGALFGEGRWYIGEIENGRRPLREVRELAMAVGAYFGGHTSRPA